MKGSKAKSGIPSPSTHVPSCSSTFLSPPAGSHSVPRTKPHSGALALGTRGTCQVTEPHISCSLKGWPCWRRHQRCPLATPGHWHWDNPHQEPCGGHATVCTHTRMLIVSLQQSKEPCTPKGGWAGTKNGVLLMGSAKIKFYLISESGVSSSCAKVGETLLGGVLESVTGNLHLSVKGA